MTAWIELYIENANKRNQSIDPTTAETDKGSSTLVTAALRDSDWPLSGCLYILQVLTPQHCAHRHSAAPPLHAPAARLAYPLYLLFSTQKSPVSDRSISYPVNALGG
jgi:hypothetical protein